MIVNGFLRCQPILIGLRVPFRFISFIVGFARFEPTESLSSLRVKHHKFNAPSETATVVKTARM